MLADSYAPGRAFIPEVPDAMSRYSRSAGWAPLHHALRTGQPAQVHLHDGGYVVAPVLAIGAEEDQVELGNTGARFWIPWSSIKSAVVITPPRAA